MKVQSINSNYTPKTTTKNNFKGSSAIKRINVSKAAATFGLWFGFGVGLDFLSRKIRLSKSPAKNSLAINGILAALAAAYVILRGLFPNKSKK